MAGGATFGFSLVNLRHAHSHLMYFGWVSPALMAFMAMRTWDRYSGPERAWMRRVLVSLLAASFAVYPSFLFFGYGSATVGSASLPFSVMLSGLHMLLWYGFAVLFLRATGTARSTRSLVFLRAATFFLVASTFGAWSLALSLPLGGHSEVLSAALTHLFLDLFSEGWLVLAVLGLAFSDLYDERIRPSDWSVWLIFAGIVPLFALSLPAGSTPATLRLAAHVGAVFVGVGLLVNTVLLWRSPRLAASSAWRVVLPFLGLKALMLLTIGLLPGFDLATNQGLRVLYLHVLLLGFVSVGLVVAARSAFGVAHGRGLSLFVVAVVLLLLSLLPMTPLFVPSLRGIWMFSAAFWAATVPVVVAVWILIRSLFACRRQGGSSWTPPSS